MKVKLFKPHNTQRQCIDKIEESGSKFICITTGRQWGKSMLAQNMLLKWVLTTPNSVSFWVSPIYSQAKKVFDELTKALKPTGLITNTNRSEVWIKFHNGSVIHFKSGEKYDNLRGYTLDYLVMDEAAFQKDEVWSEILRPATLVRGKKILFISTPKGNNFFKTLYNRGMSEDYPDYISLKYTSYETPFITESEILDAQITLPNDIFRQEIMAEFIDDGGSVFKNYQNSQITQKWIEPNPNDKYWAGIDLGRQNDYTVITILNQNNQICYVHRERRNNWFNIVDTLVNILRKYNAKALIEVNSIGDVIFEQIKRQYNKIEPFTTTTNSKQEIIENLIVQINDQILLLPTPQLFEPLDTELRVFTFEYSTKTRRIRYSSPPGFHDDCIMSLAIACECKKIIQPKKFVVV